MPHTLHDAVIAGDADRVSALIGEGADVLAKNPFGLTALQIASRQRPLGRRDAKLERIAEILKEAYRSLPPERVSLRDAAEAGHLAALEFRVRAAGPAEIGGTEFRNAMVGAVDEGYADATKLLLSAGIDKDTRDARGLTLLMIAAGKGHDDVLDVLLSRGADVNATAASRPVSDMNATMIAAGNGKLSSVKRLVEAGASLTAKDANGETALSYARRNGGKRLVAYLESAFEQRGAYTDLTLNDAARDGVFARVQNLLKDGPADQPDENGVTALMRAAEKGHAEIVKLLCGAGADVQRTDHAGRNLWDYALHFEAKPDVIRCLIRHGLDPNRPGAAGMPPLIRSVFSGSGKESAEIVRALVEGGADVHFRYTPEVPPEMAEHVARLRAVGSKLADRIGASFTALDMAKRQHNRQAYEFLKAYVGASGDAYDAAAEELRNLAKMKDAAFAEEAERIGAALRAKPQPWKKRKGVIHYFARLSQSDDRDRSDLTAAANREAQETLLLRQLQGEVRAKGYTLVYAEKDFQGKGLTRLLLFPTPQDIVAITACGTNADNYGMGTREVVNWCVETQKSHPFAVVGAGFDFMELDFSRPVPEAEALARRIAVFCPDAGVDPDDNAAVAAFAREIADQGSCFFWWD